MAETPQGPILLVASERSGSNVLRLMLDRHSRVSGPPSPHMLKVLWRFVDRLGNPNTAGYGEGVAEACKKLVLSHFSPWQGHFDPGTIAAAAPSHSLCGIVGEFYAAYARAESKTSWLCKENDLWRFTHGMTAAFPTSRLVYLYRDGRDVALSLRNSGRLALTWRELALKWQDEQENCMKVCTDHASRHLIVAVKYEDLVEAPEPTLRHLCAGLGLEFEPSMLSFNESDRARTEASTTDMWRNLGEPLMQGNTAKYRSQLKQREIRAFEGLAGDALERLGYLLEFGQTRNNRASGPPWLEAVELWRKRRLKRGLRKVLPETSREARRRAIQQLERASGARSPRGRFWLTERPEND